jgi:hypothetical protein
MFEIKVLLNIFKRSTSLRRMLHVCCLINNIHITHSIEQIFVNIGIKQSKSVIHGNHCRVLNK